MRTDKLQGVYAHSIPGASEGDWEPLHEHLALVGRLASDFARPFGAELLASAAGLLHDIGKCSAEYQQYIRNAGPSPDHSTAGAQEAQRLYGDQAGGVFARLIAFAVAGHHAGLADGTGGSGALDARLAKQNVPGYAGWLEHAPRLPERMAVALARPPHKSSVDPAYSLHFLGRMLFSCLVDADFLATEAFYARAHGKKTERGNHADLATLRERLDRYLQRFEGAAGPLNALRAEILAHARSRAMLPPGLFTMTVPTGGGKTLASLAFALDHAVRHRLHRVIYVIPYTSIIEQTAGIFCEVLGEGDVLEHHGNVDWERRSGDAPSADEEGKDGLRKLKRAAENWDVPVVVTTAVQFFESLHAARTSRCRKLHNLARSVIILDEAQTLPIHLLRPCMAAIDELAARYVASIVLCTATQPALKAQEGFANGLDIPEDRELAPEPERLYRELERVRVEHAGPITDAVIAERFADRPQMLCIVNSRKHAQTLYEQVAGLPGARHLTTLMCPAHRRAVLARMRGDLEAKRPVRLVATSLIEAGVDVDFPEVWRAETGLDSIAQAAGRCNRENRLDKGRVVVFEASEHKSPAQFGQATKAMQAALRAHGDDPLGLAAVRTYFTQLYWTKGSEALDAARCDGEPFPILKAVTERGAPPFAFPYARIAGAFRIIDDVMDPVIVPWAGGGDAHEVGRLLNALRGADRPPGDVLRRLQQFTVSIPTKVRAAMLASGAVQIVSPELGDRFVHLASASLYSEATGLSLDQFGMSAEAGII